jgi:hypothetical protein
MIALSQQTKVDSNVQRRRTNLLLLPGLGIDQWIQLVYIQLGKPIQNAYVGSLDADFETIA